MIALSKMIKARRLTQAKAAALFGVTQPRISDLIRGKIDRFSVDTLVAMLGHAGARVELVVRSKSRVPWITKSHGLVYADVFQHRGRKGGLHAIPRQGPSPSLRSGSG